MEIGKLSSEKLQELILDNISYHSDEVLLHAGIGEDSSVVDFGDEVLVISSDPITGALKNAGFLAVQVNVNDLAATGARPVGLQVVLLLPAEMEEEDMSMLIKEIHQTAADMDIEVLGGHTEIVDTISRPVISITGVGKAKKNNFIATGGARPGNDLILTKGVGIEGLFILASDYSEHLIKKGVGRETIKTVQGYKNRISVLREGLAAARSGVCGMHDITEGGLYGALKEMARASGQGFVLNKDRIPVSAEAREICEKLGIDPLGLLSSGSLLIAARKSKQVIEDIKAVGVEAWIIGEIVPEGQYVIAEGSRSQFVGLKEDELWRWMKKNNS